MGRRIHGIVIHVDGLCLAFSFGIFRGFVDSMGRGIGIHGIVLHVDGLCLAFSLGIFRGSFSLGTVTKAGEDHVYGV